MNKCDILHQTKSVKPPLSGNRPGMENMGWWVRFDRRELEVGVRFMVEALEQHRGVKDDKHEQMDPPHVYVDGPARMDVGTCMHACFSSNIRWVELKRISMP